VDGLPDLNKILSKAYHPEEDGGTNVQNQGHPLDDDLI
jgi:hypothetical protein